MYCARCGNGLGEEQGCKQCGWTVGEMVIPAEQLEQPPVGHAAAMISLVCGVFSWFTLGGLGIVPIVGIIFGRIGLKSQQSELAALGILINTVVLVLAILVFAMLVVAAISGSGPSGIPSGGGGRCC